MATADQIRSAWLDKANDLLSKTLREERAARNPAIAADRVKMLRAIEIASETPDAFWTDCSGAIDGSNGALSGMRLIVDNFDGRDAPLPNWGLY